MKFKKNLMLLATVMLFTVLTGCGGTKGNPGAENSKREISVISREDGSGTRGAFIELLGIEEKDASGKKTDMTTKEAIIANKTDVMLTNVSGDPYAVGYVSLGSLSDRVKALSVDGVKATAENVKNGTYKVSRPFNIVVKDNSKKEAQDFIDFILSREGQQIVSNGYIAASENPQAYKGSNQSGKIVVAGSSSVTPVMEKLKEAYIALNPNVTIEVQMSDSTTGINAAIEGTCDIGMASRDLKDTEKGKLRKIVIAQDGIAVIANPSNPTENVSKDTVKDIFTGKITNWSDVTP